MKKDKGKIIAVTSTTGGVGKTITTLNLAGSYHLLGYKVLIIDFDLFGGDIALSLNLKCDKTIFNLVLDLSNNRYEKVEDYIYKYNDNILYVSPLGLRLLTNNEMTDLNVVIKGENDNIIKSLSNNDNMFSKSGCKFNGTTKVRYTNQFDDLIDLSTIRNVYINEEELVEIE